MVKSNYMIDKIYLFYQKRHLYLHMSHIFRTFARFLQSKRNNVKNTLHNRRM